MKSPKLLSIFLSVLITVLVVVFAVSAENWTPPTAEPAGNNTPPPINDGYRAQLKKGGLVIGWELDATQTALVIPNGNVNIGTAEVFPAIPNNKGGNVSANDVYIRSVGKWASQLSASIDYLLAIPAPEPYVPPAVIVPEPYVPPTVYYCGGLAYDNVNAYCQDGVIYNVGDWIPLDSHSNDQTDPRGTWSALITRPITFPVKTCKLKADNSFNDGGFVTVFSGETRLGLWKEAFDLDAPVDEYSVTGMDQNNNGCAGPHKDPYMEGGILKWCGYVIWRGGGGRVGSEYTVTQAKGSTANVYATHALGDGGDNHSYTLYGQFCN